MSSSFSPLWLVANLVSRSELLLFPEIWAFLYLCRQLPRPKGADSRLKSKIMRVSANRSGWSASRSRDEQAV
jgi:hypothetical protein